MSVLSKLASVAPSMMRMRVHIMSNRPTTSRRHFINMIMVSVDAVLVVGAGAGYFTIS